MPELPEVEAARRLVQRECVGKEIKTAIIQDDDKVIVDIAPQKLASSLQNRIISSANRRGKHLWLDFTDNNESLLLHFGMTGGLVIRGKGGAHYQRYSVDDTEWPPRFVKLELQFTDGTQLAFSDSRRFARVRYIQDPLNSPPINALGFDPLLNMPTLSDFTTSISTQRRAIKALLLDQAFSAGVGNWVADEVLYQSRIHPEQPANTLTDQEIALLHKNIKSVCEIASDLDADADRMPEEWLFHHRWSKGAAKKAKIDGHTIEHITVGGRTSAYVPALQKLRKSSGGGGSGGGGGSSSKKKKETTTTVSAKKKVTTKSMMEEVKPDEGKQIESLIKQEETKKRKQSVVTTSKKAALPAQKKERVVVAQTKRVKKQSATSTGVPTGRYSNRRTAAPRQPRI